MNINGAIEETVSVGILTLPLSGASTDSPRRLVEAAYQPRWGKGAEEVMVKLHIKGNHRNISQHSKYK